MISAEHLETWRGHPVLGSDGESLGKLEEVYFDRESGTPLLVAVKSGLLGRRSKLVPVDGASVSADYVRLAHDTARVDAAPDAVSSAAPDAAALDAVGAAYDLKFSDRVSLETSGEAEARRAEAEAARARADELDREARAKLEARDAAQNRAHGASQAATAAEREAEQARQVALDARREADDFDER